MTANQYVLVPENGSGRKNREFMVLSGKEEDFKKEFTSNETKDDIKPVRDKNKKHVTISYREGQSEYTDKIIKALKEVGWYEAQSNEDSSNE